ncbi:hypothetical protein [Pedobacter nutrimenti]|uniref:hypothetical protein n=1 Tax=Pedobacter nutrimenti TaxID=1241337 RepID=UPI0014765E32|nr:hypothetical protein [Pedobacter nutrimenti]
MSIETEYKSFMTVVKAKSIILQGEIVCPVFIHFCTRSYDGALLCFRKKRRTAPTTETGQAFRKSRGLL